MRRPDLTPLYKTTIGFDHLASILDQLSSLDSDNGFPPYNIERLGDDAGLVRRERRERLGGARRDGHLCCLRRDQPGKLQADAGACAGDPDALPGRFPGHHSLRCPPAAEAGG